MVIVADASPAALAFIDETLKPNAMNMSANSYMQLLVASPQQPNAADADFAQTKDWPKVAGGEVFACVYDDKGNELARITLNINDAASARHALGFVSKHASAAVDGGQAWNDAFALATQTDRRVLAWVGDQHYSPNLKFARWLDDHHALLETDYVILRLAPPKKGDDDTIIRRVTRNGPVLTPCYAIFDREKQLLIDSRGPLGNIEMPTGYEGKKHLRKMFQRTRQRLTEVDLETLLSSIDE